MVKTKAIETKKVEFKLSAPEARQVSLAGDFNNWNNNSTPLRKIKGAEWCREMNLKPGRYEYKFIVDGNWITDPNNSNKTWNSLGTENSVIDIL